MELRVTAVMVAVITSLTLMRVQAAPPLAIPASIGVLSNDFSLSAANIQGSVSSVVRSVNINMGAGTAVFRALNGSSGHTETFNVAVYQYQDWTAYNLQLYDLIGVSQDNQLLTVMYIYVTKPSGALRTLYYESFGLPTTYDPGVTGTVSGSGSPQRVNVNFPALTAPVPPRIPYTIAAEGSTLKINSTSGTYTDNKGVKYNIVPFASVDCTTCGNGGWYELHSLFLAADASGTPNSIGCFAILYFEMQSKTKVAIEYSLCLPTLTNWGSVFVDVPNGWSGRLGVGAHVPPFKLPRRKPPQMPHSEQ